MLKTIIIDSLKKPTNNAKAKANTKIREKIVNLQNVSTKLTDSTSSTRTINSTIIAANIIMSINNYREQLKLINKLYLDEEFDERKFITNELKTKINGYKQQDKKKDYHEIENLITFDNVVEKLVCSKLKCYYCKKNMLLLFDKVRDDDQWTLDRLNNYDEHTNNNTVVSCLKCNLERRKKNSEKFKFTKQLQIAKMDA